MKWLIIILIKSPHTQTIRTITDKAPLNFRWIGFIKILFPEAKIIHIPRNPKDNCLSLFKQLFENIYFALDQDDLAKFYNVNIQLMKFWNLNLNHSIHNISYEELIIQDRYVNGMDLDFEVNDVPL